jgi:hypothetical protein
MVAASEDALRAFCAVWPSSAVPGFWAVERELLAVDHGRGLPARRALERQARVDRQVGAGNGVATAAAAVVIAAARGDSEPERGNGAGYCKKAKSQ